MLMVDTVISVITLNINIIDAFLIQHFYLKTSTSNEGDFNKIFIHFI